MNRRSARLRDLNLMTLPSLDLRSPRGWAMVHDLPEQPGCYAVIATVASKRVVRLDAAERRSYSQALVYALGLGNAARVNEAIVRGNAAVLTLYIGYSKNLNRRWAGPTPHHKQDDLRATAYLLDSFFDLASLKMHWLLTADAKKAQTIESELIKLWRPILNDRAPITVAA